MKAQFLKISGHNNENDFYKEFPTMESFMAKYGATLKAQYGYQIPPGVDTSLGTVAGGANRFNLNRFGMPIQTIPQGINYQQPNYFGKTNPFNPNTASQAFMKNNPAVGNQLPKDIGYTPNVAGGTKGGGFDTGKAISTGIGIVDKIVGGFKNLKAEKKALKSARTWRDVSNVVRQASETEDVNKRAMLTDNQRRLRKALMPSVTGEEFFPVDGVGTNVLAKDGKKLPTGGLKRGEDYGSKSKPYPSVSKGDFAGGGRSYPIPTIQDAGDALRLAGLHGRDDVKAKVYAKYPELRKGEHGEIMNTYAPNFLYDDLGYEPMGESEPGYTPLPDSEVIKAYRSGGLIPRAQFGAAVETLSPYASGMVGSMFDNNAGTQIGGGIGEGLSAVTGIPGLGVVGNLVGGIFDKNAKKTKKAQDAMMKNMYAMTGMDQIKQFQGGYNSVFEDGGYMSHDWNPRVITHFGGQDLSKLLAHANDDMDTLRTGGNIRSNEVGDIKIDGSRGKLEHISYNPHTPGTGITSMIKGPSHDDGGVNIAYNGNMVEAEGGEPISERQEGGPVGETAAVITGDQTFNKMGAHELPELSQYIGKKVKHIQKDIAEDDAKWNKLEAKNSKALAEFNPITPIDKLTFNSLSMNEKGINEQYKRNALKTQSLIAYQDAINQEAESRGLDAGELSRGKIKLLPPEEMMAAKSGISLFTQAQHGVTRSSVPGVTKKTKTTVVRTPIIPQQPDVIVPNTKDLPPVSQADYDELTRLYKEAEKYPNKKSQASLDFQKFYHKVAPDYARAVLASEPKTQKAIDEGLAQTNLESNQDSIFGKRTKQYMAALNKPVAGKPAEVATTTPATTSAPVDNRDGVFETSPYKKYGFETLAAQLMPWLRKTPGEPLLGDQLAGEMYAMSHNQEEPVQARFYHPQLDVPYDISYQDRLNENRATFNALQKAAGAGNPEALAMLAGQKYSADSNVLAEQFRANQAKKDQVYSQNRATLNDAQLKNLSIADQQYVRQQQAKSNTKMAMQEALNSVASKIGQNRLENRTLQTYANMFPDFSFGKDYTIRKTGAPTTFNMPVVYNAAGDITHVALYDDQGKIYDYRELTPSESKAMGKKPSGATPSTVPEGSHTAPVESKKEARNGRLVRAFKNL